MAPFYLRMAPLCRLNRTAQVARFEQPVPADIRLARPLDIYFGEDESLRIVNPIGSNLLLSLAISDSVLSADYGVTRSTRRISTLSSKAAMRIPRVTIRAPVGTRSTFPPSDVSLWIVAP